MLMRFTVVFLHIPLTHRPGLAYSAVMSGSVLQQFDVFAQVVASGDIAACARNLGLPPAQVVAAMNRLEDKLGFQLFSVVAGAVELTPAGHKAVQALAELSMEGQEKLADDLTGGSETLSLASPNHEEQPAMALADDDIEEEADFEDVAEIAEAEDVTGAAFQEAPSPLELEEEQKSTETEDEDEARPITPKHFQPRNRRHERKPTKPAPEPDQNIILASHPAIFSHFQEALVAFEQASPDIGITLRLSSLNAAQLRGVFDDKLADIAYYYALEGSSDEFGSRYAWSERISLFVGKKHPLARNTGLGAEDLEDVPYIALAPENIARILAEQALAQKGLTVGEPVLETDDLYQIMKHLEAGDSYFATFGSVARDLGKMSGIARLSYSQGLPQVQVRQAVREDLEENPAVLALAEFLFR